MYSVSDVKYVNNGKLIDDMSLVEIDGFLMGSDKKVFMIDNCSVRKIKVVNKQLANPLVSHKVFKKYNKLIAYLTELLVDDDDSGDTCREALNQIEKFRLEIKNKYREFLTQKELEKMSKKLLLLQKTAKAKLLEIQNSYLKYQNSNNKSR